MASGFDTQYQYTRIPNFSGGMNTQDSPVELPDNQAREIFNMVLTRRGGCVKRKGITKYVAFKPSLTTDEITNSYIYYDGNNTHVIIVSCEAPNYKIYRETNGAGIFYEITGGTDFTYGHDINFVTFRDVLLIYNGQQFQYWTGTGTKADVGYLAGSVSVVPDIMTIADYKLFAIDKTENSHQIRWTALNGWGTGVPSDMNFETNNKLPCPNASDGTGFTAAYNYGNNDESLFFRNNDFYAMIGVNNTDYSFVTMSDVAGCVSQRGITTTDMGVIIFVGNNGIYELAGQTLTNIARPIMPEINGVDLSNSVAIYDPIRDCVWIGTNGGCFCWNCGTRGWTRGSLAFNSAARFTRPTDFNTIVMSLPGSAYLYRFYSGNTDDGTNFEWRILTKTYDLNSFEIDKYFRGVSTLTDANSTTPFYVRIIVNDGAITQQKQMTITLVGDLWDADTSLWDSALWSGGNLVNGKLTFSDLKRGQEFSILFSQTDALDFTFYKASVYLSGLQAQMEETP